MQEKAKTYTWGGWFTGLFTERKSRNCIIAIVLTLIVLGILNATMNSYPLRILNLCGIYVILTLAMVLINGFLGVFSLGHAGFMAIGAYTCAILTMSAETKAMNFYLTPILPFLADIKIPLFAAIILGGLIAALFGALIGAPVLRLKDDYLAIATLGFSEIIRIVFTNVQPLTNGALGLKKLTPVESEIDFFGLLETPIKIDAVWWIWGFAIFTIIFMVMLTTGSYGRAFKAIREDDIAAEAMGISLFKHKMLGFIIGCFFAGVGGAILGNFTGTIDPIMFRFTLTYNIVLIAVLGGIGSLSGGVLAAIIVTAGMEALRFLDGAFHIGPVGISGRPGLRMVMFCTIMMLIIIFRPQGLMGNREFSWKGLKAWLQKKKNKKNETSSDGEGVA